MAIANKKAMTLVYFVFVLYLVLAFSIAESRQFGVGFGSDSPIDNATPICESVYGVKSGDTCFGVTQMFNLTTDNFNSVNPNLNCTDLFVGQWLCTFGISTGA